MTPDLATRIEAADADELLALIDRLKGYAAKDEPLANRAVAILGDHCGAARALRLLEETRAKGIDACAFLANNTWIVADLSALRARAAAPPEGEKG